MKLRLVKLTSEYQEQLSNMMETWCASGEAIIPGAIAKNDYRNFENYLEKLEIKKPVNEYVPDSTYFCLDEETNTFVGAVNIRHYLNDVLLRSGGHIGDGVRPERRGEGIGTIMVGLALEECRKLGIDRVLMVCDKDNIASARTIQKNGGVLENEIETDGNIEQRYWIDL